MKRSILVIMLAMLMPAICANAQSPTPQAKVRPVTIPISIFTKKELREGQAEEYVQADHLMVKEDGDDQEILSIRSVRTSPLSIAFLFQDDLASTFNLQIRDIQEFIRHLPKGTRVMTAYGRTGTTQIKQRFTDDLDRAADSLRIVSGSPALGPRSPYESVQDVLNRFDAVPAGRRAVLVFSDGVDTTGGLSLASIIQSLELDKAINKAQRKGVAVYSFYAPTSVTDIGNSIFVLGGQGALEKLSDETGGRAFQQGTTAPISYLPYFRDMVLALERQFALTYMSTHMKKGYHKLVIQSTNPEVKIEHPKGVYYR